MSGVSRLPGNYLELENHRGYKRLPDNIEYELTEFYDNYLHGSDEIHIGYVPGRAIAVNVFNNVGWTKRHHEVFCHHFNLILSRFNRYESYKPRRYSLELEFIYIPSFDNEDMDKIYGIDVDNILRF